MSANIEANRSYLDLLLNTSHKQQQSLITSITDSQVDLISEIFYNFQILPLDSQQKQFVKKRTQLIRKLANNSKSHRYRRSLIIKHKKTVAKFIDYFRNELKGLI